MTSNLGTINNRQILYLDVDNNVNDFSSISLKNWILFIIVDDINNPDLNFFADMCIDKEVLYVCAAGKACSEVDDLFDTCMLIREMEGRKRPSWWLSEEDVLMTSWHYKFDEGFWFATSVASYEEFAIDNVLVANLTKQKYLQIVQNLTKKITEGWLPNN